MNQSFEAVESVTGIKIKKSFVDLGYIGSNVREKSKVYSTYSEEVIKRRQLYDQKTQCHRTNNRSLKTIWSDEQKLLERDNRRCN